MKSNDEILKDLRELDKKQPGIKVQTFKKYPCPWIKVTDSTITEYIKKYGMVNHREILIDEVVIDVDSDNLVEGIKHSDLVEASLIAKKIKYSRWNSGGDGVHFHVWFIKQEMEELIHKYETGIVRTAIIKYLTGTDILMPENIRSHICLHNKTLIQIEGAMHRKGKVKTLITHKPGINKIPEEVHSILNKQYYTRKFARQKTKNVENISKHPCISFLEGKEINGNSFKAFKDGYNRSLFYLISYYKNHKTDAWIEKAIDKWFIDMEFNPSWIKTSIPAMIKSAKGWISCPARQSFFEELGCTTVCNNCPFNTRFK